MKPLSLVTTFAVEQAPSLPVARRIELYRALAEIAATPKQSADLTRLADELQAAERHHDQLLLNLRSRAA